ncbi:MAG: ABC transporter permease [Candidatus Omnitrophota bacterium]|nr:ABC transporter permease [Candidatus Omnitrophota bacterium]
MRYYIVKRLLYVVPLLFTITFLAFLFIHIAPGDFLDSLRLNPQVSRDAIRLYEEKFCLNKPFLVQYGVWLKNIFSGDLGYSFAYKAPVARVIAARAANTVLLALSSLLFTWLIVIPLGVTAALHKNKLIDKVLSLCSYVGISTPAFFWAFIFLYAATFSGWFPLGGMRSLLFEELSPWQKAGDLLRHLIIPVLVLSIGSIASLHKILRAHMLEILGSTYILGARARGLSRTRILYSHALRNALNPMITIFGYQFADLLSGAALVEIIVGWPGLGQVTLEAVRSQDLYLVMGAMLIGGIMLIAGNLLSDILLAYADPRIRYQR